MGTINKEENWIGTNEEAKLLGVKPATIRDWIRKGKYIPRRKIGKAWKFKYSELCTYFPEKYMNIYSEHHIKFYIMA